MTTLTDRYVHATVRSVPEDRRDEIGTELRSSIDDMVAGRVDAGDEPTAAERAVLTELGDPGRLASQYTGQLLYLIGPRYFLVWKRVVLRLLAWVPALVAAVSAGSEVLDGGNAGAALGSAVTGALFAALHVGFWTTFAFAIIERSDLEPDLAAWDVDRLPDVPRQREIPLHEACASIVWYAVLVVFFVVQAFAPWFHDDAGKRLPLLDPDLWLLWLPVVLVALAGSIAVEVAKLRTGRWTWPIAAAHAVGGAVFAVPVVWLAAEQRLLNPAFVDSVGWDADTYRLVSVVVAVVVALVIAYDVIDGFVHAAKGHRPDSSDAGTVR